MDKKKSVRNLSDRDQSTLTGTEETRQAPCFCSLRLRTDSLCLELSGVAEEGDEQLLALREAARGAQALLALQAGLVLRRCVPECSMEGAQEVVRGSGRGV